MHKSSMDRDMDRDARRQEGKPVWVAIGSSREVRTRSSRIRDPTV
jgi:hypothetical protein